MVIDTMGYINPLLKLPAGQALLALPDDQRSAIEAVMRDLRSQADREAEIAWRRRKGPMAAYWRAVATYARHIAHACKAGSMAGVKRTRNADRARSIINEKGREEKVASQHRERTRVQSKETSTCSIP